MINTAIYDLFKTGKIKDSYILELIRNTIVNGKTLPKTAISFGKTTNDANATTYGIFIMPVTDNTENVECVVYLDKNALTGLLTCEEFNELIGKLSQDICDAYYDYKMSGISKVTESMSAYIAKFLEINLKYQENLRKYSEKNKKFASLVSRLNIEAKKDILDKLNSDDIFRYVLEDIKINNVMPADAIAYTRKFLSVFDTTGEISIEKNKYFNELINLSTSKTNPNWSKERIDI